MLTLRQDIKTMNQIIEKTQSEINKQFSLLADKINEKVVNEIESNSRQLNYNFIYQMWKEWEKVNVK